VSVAGPPAGLSSLVGFMVVNLVGLLLVLFMEEEERLCHLLKNY
jgi:hypothetical protein